MGSIRRTSVNNILHKQYDVLPFEGAWREAFDRPEKTGVWFVYGRPANGKSFFCKQLTYELARLGRKTAYFSIEEGDTLPFQKSIRRAGWMEVQRHIVVETGFVPFGEMAGWLKKNERVKAVVIDTVQRWDLKPGDLPALLEMFRRRLLIVVSHVKDNNLPDGKVADNLLKAADMKVWVEGYRAHSKGRLYGEKGWYDIWPEHAAAYWAENIINKAERYG
jgi:hypothetical protein